MWLTALDSPPRDPTLRIDPLEIADQVHPEVPPRRDRRRPHLRRVARRADPLGKTIQVRRQRNPLKPVVEYMARSNIVWLAASDTPEPLGNMVKGLRRIARKAGIKADKREFRPHLTLLRKCVRRPNIPEWHADFRLHNNSIVLYQSVQEPGGVRYVALEHWSLDDE